MNKGDEAVEYEGDWAQEQLDKFGGREGWMAQQLVFIHRLLQKASTDWVSRYKAKFRLINMEQLLKLAASLYGDEDGVDWLVEYMEETQAEKIADNDIVLGALRKFSELVILNYGEYNKSKRFTARKITEWCQDHEDYKDLDILTNARRLGRFMLENPNLLATVSGMTEFETLNNARSYIAHEPKK